MCGIAGVFNLDGSSVAPSLLGRMTRALRHRGPDDEGYVVVNTLTGRSEPRIGDDTAPQLADAIVHIAAKVDLPADLALGHRRLSIIDLSAAGHQPMVNEKSIVERSLKISLTPEVFAYLVFRDEVLWRPGIWGMPSDDL